MEDAKTAGQHLVDESMARQAARPVKATYDYATLGSNTRMRGEIVTASTGVLVVEYADGDGIPGLLQPGYLIESQM